MSRSLLVEDHGETRGRAAAHIKRRTARNGVGDARLVADATVDVRLPAVVSG